MKDSISLGNDAEASKALVNLMKNSEEEYQNGISENYQVTWDNLCEYFGYRFFTLSKFLYFYFALPDDVWHNFQSPAPGATSDKNKGRALLEFLSLIILGGLRQDQ